MTDKDKINKWSLKRKVPLSRLEEIYVYANNNTADQFYKENFLARVEFVDNFYEEFQTFHNEIISLISTEAEFVTQDLVRATADKYRYAIKSKELELSFTTPGSPRLNNQQQNSTCPKPTLKMDISVPPFDGNLKMWPTFHELYTSLIHNNTGVPEVEKFRHLMTILKNEPFNLLKNITITEDNYQIAYSTLVDRYQNVRFLATSYFNEIFDAQPVKNPHSKELRHLVDTFSENISALKALKFKVEDWSFLLFNILLRKIDIKSRTEFEVEHCKIDVPTYDHLKVFLSNKCKALETVQNLTPSAQSSSSNSNYNKSKNYNFTSTTASQSNYKRSNMPATYVNTVDSSPLNTKQKCIMCPSTHSLFRCPLFLAKTPTDRLAFVRQNNLCGNCLRPHPIRNCPVSIHCKICQFPHHSLLHINKNQATATVPFTEAHAQHTNPGSSTATAQRHQNTATQLHRANKENTLQDKKVEPTTHQVNSYSTSLVQSTCVLPTAEVEIKDVFGNFQKVRVLLDSGSMANLISESCVNRLGLKRQQCSVPLQGVNDLTSISTKGITQCFIKPVGKSDPTFTFEAIILSRVCSDHPKTSIHLSNLHYIKNLTMADSNFHTPGPIDILLSAELMPYLLGAGRIFGKPQEPVAIETVFGWILLGKVASNLNNSLLSCHVSIEPQVDVILHKFWEVEQPPKVSNPMSPDDIECERIYKNSVCRENSGRFMVSLPFKHNNPDFGDTYTQALRRFTHLESKLYKNPQLHTAYSNFLKDYMDQHFISEVPRDEYCSQSAYYLPHHCVLKPESVSTKIRVVFDASAKGSKGISLNDTLFSGPKLHQDLSAILLKFRTYPVCFIADIRLMYNQIKINPEHKNYQRFLWRPSSLEEVKEYTLDRVTFGVSSAPYLALRTIKELATIEQENHPLASQVLQESVYVDDCVSGAVSIQSALLLQSELITLLEKGCFELRKWASNEPALLAAVPSSHAQISFESEGPTYVKVLGLQWNPSLDVFTYSCSPIEASCTKRNVLSQIARIFDVQGYLAPVVLLAKHILQQIFISNKEWDELAPEAIVKLWERFKTELPEISLVQIPRLLISEQYSRLEIHAFCDGSTIGYGCVIYFRYITSSALVKISLIMAKSKVAPLKTQSVARLELCSAYLLSNLLKFVKESYSNSLTFDAIYAWSDSQVTLAWLTSSPHRWKTFVANRVSHIQDIIPPSSWRYVPTSLNPADCASRGLTPLQLLEHKMWWHGPSFLYLDYRDWPEQPSIILDKLPDAVSEQNQTALPVSVEAPHFIQVLLVKCSSLRKIQRYIAYYVRFVSYIFKRKTFASSTLSPSETYEALSVVIKCVQQECFSDLMAMCQSNKSLPKPFRKLAPFIDEVGILRVGGRLRKSTFLTFDAKHPILLPQKHRFTDLVIEQYHRENCHPGLKTLHNLIIQTFWILSPRSAIYRCLSKCIKCFRCKPQSYTPYMADLPRFRISQVKAFSQVCLDYAGPFKISSGKRQRGCQSSKAYISLFTCACTKAYHFELASDLSSEAFLASFRRFIARRGRVSHLYSDQGTNYKGAYNELIALSEAAASKLSIEWHFNPPGAPHFNGLSEAGVKAVKTHLYRVIGEQILTYEEFYTLLTQIESLLNSRPLCAISEDPNDLTPLTPGHFLTVEPLTSFPEPDLSEIPVNRLTRWQLLQRMQTDFWKRWNQEYLHTLQKRCKWTNSVPNIKENTLVLIKNEQRPPREWALGRVVKTHPGDDDIVRVVTLKTQGGTLQRPVVKLCPLPEQ